ncbi:MAG: hypothetical protein Q4G50_13445 [Corynebacterium sp.]|uniref:hypothetical protein n=1 Tax=Corynebacterium sp. TaxID=1720 RepID=UPI0026DEF46E|nr:hypothetical protein [Corynebacterium sp.]MDO5670989.1 hypothetical protein [Corynebacterium sp.]
MNKRINYFDRIVVLIVGLLILAGGAWAVGLYFDLPFSQSLTDFIDFPAWRAAPDAEWFDWVLAGIGVVSALLGGWLIALNVRRYRLGRVISPASDATGTIGVNLATIAAAIAKDLEVHPRVDSVLHTVVDHWDRPTMTITVRARSGADVPSLRDTLESAEQDFRSAVPGITVDSVYKLHLLPPQASTR